MRLALDFFFVVIVLVGIFYFAVWTMRGSGSSSDLSSFNKSLPRKEEFHSTKPFEEWQTFRHPAYGYSISYPPELSVTSPVPGKGEVLDMVRFFYGGRLAVAVLKLTSRPLTDERKITGFDGDGNKVMTYYFPSGERSLEFQGTVFTKETKAIRFEEVLERMAESIEVGR